MGVENHGWVSPLVLRALAGVEAGVLGGLAMFGWLAASAVIDLRSIWTVPNLLGSTLSGQQVLQRGFGWTTLLGLGLHFSVSGLIGAAFGLVVGNAARRLRVTLLGMLTGLIWYYFSRALFWRKLGVFVTLYKPPQTLLLGHLVYGLVLGWFPSGLRSATRSFFGEAAPAEMRVTDPAPDAVE
jgi:MFS-type transporter involved in bile tolerance (Atg22 family)